MIGLEIKNVKKLTSNEVVLIFHTQGMCAAGLLFYSKMERCATDLTISFGFCFYFPLDFRLDFNDLLFQGIKKYNKEIRCRPALGLGL